MVNEADTGRVSKPLSSRIVRVSAMAVAAGAAIAGLGAMKLLAAPRAWR